MKNRFVWRQDTALSILLVLSLGLNLYALTYVLGHNTHQHVAINTIAMKQIDMVISSTAPEKQSAIRKSVSTEMDNLKRLLREDKQARQTLTRLLDDDPLNETAINELFDHMRSITQQSQATLQHMLLVSLQQMTPDERQKAIKRLYNIKN